MRNANQVPSPYHVKASQVKTMQFTEPLTIQFQCAI